MIKVILISLIILSGCVEKKHHNIELYTWEDVKYGIVNPEYNPEE